MSSEPHVPGITGFAITPIHRGISSGQCDTLPPKSPQMTSVSIVPPHKPQSDNWVTPDVHAWSSTMSSVLSKEMPNLPAESIAAAKVADIVKLKLALPHNVWGFLDKIVSRSEMQDGDLNHTNPLGLLWIAWTEGGGDSAAITDLLKDIGSTCLQGDTHRLFFYIYAIRMSKK